MKKAYIILGMKRSGHHAIAYWIAHNTPGKTVLYNDCGKGWGKGELIPNHIKPGNSQEQFVGEGKHDTDIYNIEDFNMDWLDKYDFRKFKAIKKYDVAYVLLVLRDPYNWIASSLKNGGGPAKRISGRIDLWKKQAICFDKLGDRNKYLFLINYNSWFKFEVYRQIISCLIGLGSFNEGLNLTSPRGGGSSFDRMKFKNKAAQMKVLERWKYFKDNPEFTKHFKDGKLAKFSETIFNLKVEL